MIVAEQKPVVEIVYLTSNRRYLLSDHSLL